jgi:hypothetical protein
MLKSLSSATDDTLAYYLSRIREIAALGDEAALIETDKLLYEWEEGEEGPVPLDSDPSPEGSPPPHHVNYLSFEVRRVRERITSDKIVNTWDADNLRRRVASIVGAEDERSQALRSEAMALAEECERISLERAINKTLEYPLASLNSVTMVLTDLNQALASYTERQSLTPELEADIRRGRERCARMRHDRKIAAAQIADAAEQERKARTLRAEAAALLAQDWHTVFPDEEPPQAD